MQFHIDKLYSHVDFNNFYLYFSSHKNLDMAQKHNFYIGLLKIFGQLYLKINFYKIERL